MYLEPFTCYFSFINLLKVTWFQNGSLGRARSKVMTDSKSQPDFLLVNCCNFLSFCNVTQVIHNFCYAVRDLWVHILMVFLDFRPLSDSGVQQDPEEALSAPERSHLLSFHWRLCKRVWDVSEPKNAGKTKTKNGTHKNVIYHLCVRRPRATSCYYFGTVLNLTA